MANKIIKIGSSTGVTLSKALLERAQLAAGDSVRVEFNPKRGSIEVTSLSQEEQSKELAQALRLVAQYQKELNKVDG